MAGTRTRNKLRVMTTGTKASRALAAFEQFYSRELGEILSAARREEPGARALALAKSTAASVPAYASFLREHGVDVASLASADDWARLPVTTKENYHRRYSLPDLCRGGRLSDCDMLAVSSGSTGEPAVWPRFVTDELSTAARFEQVLADGFGVRDGSTLAVICFAMGSWVGGMYTAACCRHLAAKGYPITVATPGNQKAEIVRVLRALGPSFEKIVLFGYPPFLKDVIDWARAEGFDWALHRVHLVMAGEVFSESFRDLVCERVGARDPAYTTASLYGTADGGVLANETPLSIEIRRALAQAPAAARELFGEERLPTLCQYDPCERYFEVEADGSLLFTGDSGIPLVRYRILDRGGIIPYDTLRAFLSRAGLDLRRLRTERELPFVYVFGRSSFAVSFYGANVYPENVAVGVEQPDIAAALTGKFVMEVEEMANGDPALVITVELAQGAMESAELGRATAQSIQRALERLNSEFRNYVPEARRTPHVRLLPHGDPAYFPVGVKHRYTRS